MSINIFDTSDGVRAGWVHFESGSDLIRGYLSVPVGNGPWPVLITAHENLGVTAHRQEVTRRLAAAGYVSLTVDLFSRFGGMPPQNFADAHERRRLAFLAARDDRAVPDLGAGLHFAQSLPFAEPGKAAAVGFCLGGGTVLAWGAETDELSAVVSLYGIPTLPPEYSPSGRAVPRIPLIRLLRAPVQFHYGAEDEAIPATQVEELRAACVYAPPGSEFHVYPAAGHAYHDDTHPNYDALAADRTWDRMLAFLAEHVR